MKSYYDIRTELGYNDVPEVKPIYKWFAYKKGDAVQCKTREEALAISKLIEKVCDNDLEVRDYKSKICNIEARAESLWIKQYLGRYPNFNEKQMNICYNYAYSLYHSEGFDQVGDALDDILEVVAGVINNQDG